MKWKKKLRSLFSVRFVVDDVNIAEKEAQEEKSQRRWTRVERKKNFKKKKITLGKHSAEKIIFKTIPFLLRQRNEFIFVSTRNFSFELFLSLLEFFVGILMRLSDYFTYFSPLSVVLFILFGRCRFNQLIILYVFCSVTWNFFFWRRQSFALLFALVSIALCVALMKNHFGCWTFRHLFTERISFESEHVWCE